VAELVHLPVLARAPEIEVVAVADRDAGRMERVAQRFGVPARHAEAAALVADPRVEAVAVCVPPVDHARVAGAALDAGKPVLVEKPLTLSLDDADELIDRAARAGVPAMIGFNLRWLATVARARELIAEGRLGPVEAARSAVTSSHRFEPEAPAWRRRRELGGGSLIEQGVHHFDLWRFLLGDEVDEVFALTHPDDAGAAVTGRMAGGALVQTTFSERTTPVHTFEVYGRRACLRLSLTRFDGLELLPVDRHDSAVGTRARSLLAAARAMPRALVRLPRGGVFANSYAAQWTRFAAAVRGAAPATPTLDDGRRALEIALAATASAAQGVPVASRDAPRTPVPA
jgi:predicted dehydrogenase